MTHVIRVRDVTRKGLYEFGPDEPILRGPYDLFQFHSAGAVRRRGDVIDWVVPGGEVRTGRVAPASLGGVHPGERVLVKLPPAGGEPIGGDEEWWLCEVESVDGVSVAE
jgi:hypothetical protein